MVVFNKKDCLEKYETKFNIFQKEFLPNLLWFQQKKAREWEDLVELRRLKQEISEKEKTEQ